jgi:hypothetical protein
MTSTIIADAVQGVTLTNGIVRIRLAKIVGDNEVQESGTLLIPVNQASPIVDVLASSLKEISDKLNEQKSLKLAEEAIDALEIDDDNSK